MAYGVFRGSSKPDGPLGLRLYPVECSNSPARSAILTVPFDFLEGDKIDTGLENLLYGCFNEEIVEGRTYPQEELLELKGFEAYFLAHHLVVGFFLSETQVSALRPTTTSSIPKRGLPLPYSALSNVKLGASRINNHTTATSSATATDLTDWLDTYAFSYYIKPNYPGRSSHLCNGGFMVPRNSRGLGLGGIAGRTFLYYAPRCGFRGSIFNLVYLSNAASVKIWERLGFQNIGRIPEAGRLKKAGEEGEEFADAWIVYGDFKKIGQADDVVDDETKA